MGYIYLRTNLINGKKYVGQTVDVEKRNRTWNCLKTEYGGYAINNARKKYGTDGFSFELLKECPNEEMNYWEMYYIKEYNSKIPYGYNMTDGGNSVYEISDETRKKMSAAQRGKKHSTEHVAKVAAAQRGKPKPKVAAAKRGKKCSEETKLKIADTLRGRKRPDVAAALRGRKRPDIAAAQRGKPKPKVAAAKRGKYNTKKSKAIQALNKDGNVVIEFPSAAEAQRQGYGSHSHISQCCNGKRKLYKGFIWRFAV